MKPEEIRRVRESLNASQEVFAVSTNAVQAWEQGLRRPQSAALRLLDIAKRNPSVLVKAHDRCSAGLRPNVAALDAGYECRTDLAIPGC